MVALPKIVIEAWEEREGPVALATADASGVPNVVYAGAVRKLADGRFVIADNYFCKTKANLARGGTISMLFLTKERKSYQVKGSFEYCASGPEFDDMKTWNTKHPGHAVVLLTAEEVYNGSVRLA